MRSDIYLGLKCTGHCSMSFMQIHPFTQHNNPLRGTISISVLYTRKLKRKVTLLVNGKAGFQSC